MTRRLHSTAPSAPPTTSAPTRPRPASATWVAPASATIPGGFGWAVLARRPPKEFTYHYDFTTPTGGVWICGQSRSLHPWGEPHPFRSVGSRALSAKQFAQRQRQRADQLDRHVQHHHLGQRDQGDFDAGQRPQQCAGIHVGDPFLVDVDTHGHRRPIVADVHGAEPFRERAGWSVLGQDVGGESADADLGGAPPEPAQ